MFWAYTVRISSWNWCAANGLITLGPCAWLDLYGRFTIPSKSGCRFGFVSGDWLPLTTRTANEVAFRIYYILGFLHCIFTSIKVGLNWLYVFILLVTLVNCYLDLVRRWWLWVNKIETCWAPSNFPSLLMRTLYFALFFGNSLPDFVNPFLVKEWSERLALIIISLTDVTSYEDGPNRDFACEFLAILSIKGRQLGFQAELEAALIYFDMPWVYFLVHGSLRASRKGQNRAFTQLVPSMC